VLERGDKVMAEVKAFAERERPRSAEFTGIGVVPSARLTASNPVSREYVGISDPGQYGARLAARANNPAEGGRPQRRADRAPARCPLRALARDGSTSGHVFELVIRATCEVFVTESADDITR
jgi:predicted DNA-binding protein with PD1-like motif